jgi:hypothetical protein
MRIPVLILRALLLLLVARFIAAPVTLRPTAPDSHQHSFLIFRICSWPPQRLQRFSSSSKLLQLLQGKNKVGPESVTRWSWLQSSSPPPEPLFVFFAVPPLLVGSASRATLCLRC